MSNQPNATFPSGVAIEDLAINTIRTLSMDAVQAADSGHPGSPMGMAPTAYTLWQRVLRYDPADPLWCNRDRFVLSAGHASMLLYSMLHLSGTRSVDQNDEVVDSPAVSLEEIKRFRQLDSRCPGHPEYRWTSGVETTTGPLGQGLANSVGMAIAERWLAATYNRPGFTIFDYDVYALCGDGCLMEGISGEAASVAGHLKLSNLCWIYDSNRITIEGGTDLAFSDDVATRFVGYGWDVVRVTDANDVEQLQKSLAHFKKTTDKPTIIIVESHIAFGSPNKQDTCGAHGEPLGEEEIRLTKRGYGWPEDAKFLVPEGVYSHFASGIGKRGSDLRNAWQVQYDQYRKQFPEQATQIDLLLKSQLPEGWDKNLPSFAADAKGKATRDTSGQVLNAIAKNVPWLIGGSADLAPSNKTRLTFEGAGDLQANNYGGRNMHFGVREHAMGAILNGMAVSKVRPYGGTFLVFSDYLRPAIRLAAIMEIPVVYVFTHDSIGVGEDGPTHQPIEQLASLRAMHGLITLRPGDGNEVAEAWKFAMMQRREPVALALTRQALPTLDRQKYASAEGLHKGAYVLSEAANGKPDVLIMASGSEVSLAIDSQEKLKAEGIQARVISVPSFEIFEHYCHKHPEYREAVFPAAVTARVSVEMGSTFGWDRYVGLSGTSIGMHSFGASAPLKHLLKKFGFTVEAVVAAAKKQVDQARGQSR